MFIGILASGACSLWRDSKSAASFAYTTTATLAGLNGAFGEPFGIATLGSQIYVTDGMKGQVVKLKSDGTAEIFASGLNTPSAIAFSPDGELFVADTGSHTIKRIAADGSVYPFAGIENKSGDADGAVDSATFNAPIGLAIGHDGRVFVADTYNDRIRVIHKGVVSTFAGTTRGFADGHALFAKFDSPLGIAIWQSDKLLVADSGNRRIRVVEPTGDVWTLAGSADGGFRDGFPLESGLVSPTAVVADEAGRIFVADGNSVRVTGRRSFAFVETICDGRRGYLDGRAREARFNRPSGLAFDEGRLLIADSDNRVVRVFSDGGVGVEATRDQMDSLRLSAREFRSLQPPRWPFDPPANPREIAGTLGEIRGSISEADEPVWFHNGLDIAGAHGEIARFVRTETVLDPHATQNFGTARELLRFPTLGYIHIRLGRDKDDDPFPDPRFQFERDALGKVTDIRIPRGSTFGAGEALGTLNAMNHVHLIAGRVGSEMNALDALVFPGVADSIPPVIEKVSLVTPDWREIEGRIKLADKTRIVVRAYDLMDGNAERRRLGVYRVGYQILSSGVLLGEIDWTIMFERMPSSDAVPFVYAGGSRSGATGGTILNYIASNRVNGEQFSEGFLDPNSLAAGEYTLRVYAADFFGNTASKDISFEVLK